MKRELWVAVVNLSGLWLDKPIKVTFDVESNEYRDKSGELGFYREDILLFNDMSRIVFASENKKEVEAFIVGARAVYHILKNISGGE